PLRAAQAQPAGARDPADPRAGHPVARRHGRRVGGRGGRRRRAAPGSRRRHVSWPADPQDRGRRSCLAPDIRGDRGPVADRRAPGHDRAHGRPHSTAAPGMTRPTAGVATFDRNDDEAWDGFVAGADPGSYLQLSGWARVKAVNRWSSTRIVTGDAAPIGIQVLVRRPRPLPWAFAYAPRGPVASSWTPASVEALTTAVRDELRDAAGRVSHLRVDPELERDGPHDPDGGLRRALRGAGWRPASPIQPNATRIIDLRPDEETLWGDLRKKWRQYVNKARTAGITVTDAEGDALPEFYRIYRETADRAGFLIRTERAYRDIWEAFRPTGNARLLF